MCSYVDLRISSVHTFLHTHAHLHRYMPSCSEDRAHVSTQYLPPVRACTGVLSRLCLTEKTACAPAQCLFFNFFLTSRMHEPVWTGNQKKSPPLTADDRSAH